jgi:hypothetical protein
MSKPDISAHRHYAQQHGRQIRVRCTSHDGGATCPIGSEFVGWQHPMADSGSGTILIFLSEDDAAKAGLRYGSFGLGWDCEIID